MSHLNPSPKSPNRDQIEKKDPQPSDRSLLEPPPHHTSKLTATKFARAVRGAWKHTRTKTELRKTHSPQTKASSLFHLYLPKPPPHHTPKLTATEFAKAMHGAWKQTGAVVSHDPNVRFSWFSLFPNWDFELLMGFSGFMGFFGASWIIYGINVISWLLISEDKAILARSKAIWRGYYIRIWCRTLFHIGFQSSLIAFCLGSSKSFNRLMGHLYFLFFNCFWLS